MGNQSKVTLDVQISPLGTGERLVRVPLEADEDEVLVTSLLDQERWPAEHFKDIYFARWGHRGRLQNPEIPASD
jgi:hypothetical protein